MSSAFATIAVSLAAAIGAAGLAYWLASRKARRNAAAAITKRKVLESRIETLQDEIWELKEAAAAREKAEAANEAKSRFLATVSHEMRTPLSGILGMADLIAQAGLSAEQRSYLEAIRTSGTALSSLIDEILDFSKIEAGKLDLVPEPFDIIPLVEGVVELLAPRAQGKGLEIATAVAPDVPRMLIGDSSRVRQVLINLAGNAVKFTETGGVGVRVSMTPAGWVRLTILDTGPGIAPDRQAAIFDDFEQADGSAARQHEGTGLGLAISRRIVSLMGGDLRLARSSPEGSQFTLELPLPVSEEPQPAIAGDTLAGRQILIVAHSPFEAPYLGERLDAAGAAVLRAEGEAQALDMLAKAGDFDIVIVDCALGEDATRRVAAAARDAGVGRSLVLFSPFERRSFGQNSMRDFDGWLVKPVRTRSLFERLSPEASSVRSNGDSSGQADLPRKGLRVLLAEDNAINAIIARKHLERMEAEVTLASDGTQALQEASRPLEGDGPAFDLMLLDIRMPGLDGLEVARRVRALEKEKGVAPVRIVALTANAFAEDRQACFDAGFSDFLTKPVEFEKLARTIAAPAQALRPAS